MSDFNALVAARVAAKTALTTAVQAAAALAAQWQAATGALNIPGAAPPRPPMADRALPQRRPIPPHLAAPRPAPGKSLPEAEVPTVPVDIKAVHAALKAQAEAKSPAPVAAPAPSPPPDLNALAQAYGAALRQETALRIAYEATVKALNDAVVAAGG